MTIHKNDIKPNEIVLSLEAVKSQPLFWVNTTRNIFQGGLELDYETNYLLSAPEKYKLEYLLAYLLNGRVSPESLTLENLSAENFLSDEEIAAYLPMHDCIEYGARSENDSYEPENSHSDFTFKPVSIDDAVLMSKYVEIRGCNFDLTLIGANA